jgi:hypothetical protein
LRKKLQNVALGNGFERIGVEPKEEMGAHQRALKR